MTPEQQIATTTAELDRRSKDENFPVASLLAPKKVRADLLAIYGFARLVDDAGDDAPGDRGALLDHIETELERAYVGEATHPVMERLGATVVSRKIPIEPFRRLIEANRRDQVQSRYATWDDLLSYCELSANPVGRLVLHVLHAATEERLCLSDMVCSGLQVAEHLQDVREDLARGRVYLPAEDLERFGVGDVQLGAALASESVRRLVAFEVSRARDLIDGGAPLVGTLHGRPRLMVAGFVAGGRATLDAIAAGGHDPLVRTPHASKARLLTRLLSAFVRGR